MLAFVNRMPRWAVGSLVVGAMLVAVVAGYIAFHRPPVVGMGDIVPLMCIDGNCRQVEDVSNQRIFDERTIDELAANTPGLKCPKCGKNTLAFAWKCPNDGEIFLKRKPRAEAGITKLTEAPGKCGKCSFDPVAAENERIAKVLRQGR